MRRHSFGRLLLVFGVVSVCQSIETPDHAPSPDKTYHFPSASLTIAGDLKDVKLKGTIAQLVRALQQPTSSDSLAKDALEPKPKTTLSSGIKKIIHPSQLITKHSVNKVGKTLYYGDPIPDTTDITVSSQSVKVSQSNATKGRKARNLFEYLGHDSSFPVKTGKPSNHKKRQVIITDPQQYLAAAAAAQAQGATTIVEASSGLHGASNGQPRTSMYYAQEPSHQSASSSNPTSSHTNGATIFASDPSQQRSHPQVAYSNQQQQQVSGRQQQTSNNGQASAFTYATPQQNGHSMYVLQDGTTYNVQQYTSQAAHSTSSHHNQQQAQLAQQQSPSQFFSRSGEAASSAPLTAQNSQSQQHGSVSATAARVQQQQQQQPLSAAIKQQYQPSLDTQAIQAAVEAVQQLEAQQQQQNAVTGSQQHQHQQLSHQSQLQAAQQAQLQQQAQQIQIAQGSSPTQTVVIPQGLATTGGATAQEILAAAAAATNGQATAQYLQIQSAQEQAIPHLQQQQQQSQLQYPAPNQFAERQTYQTSGGPSVASAYQTSPAQFVIQSQTYTSGGQTFTVPIPVPVEQVQQAASQQQAQVQQHQQAQAQHHQQQQQLQQHQQVQQQSRYHAQNYQQHHQNGNTHTSHRQYPYQLNGQQGSIADKMKQAFNQNFNRKMLERVETNAVVPALASTGLFLGLSALAAGWYLSKNNREVGIVRRTGKFSKKSGVPAAAAAAAGASPVAANSIAEAKEKEVTTNTRTRRDLASMVTPQAYNPAGTPEVDQATFFQSIIQQSLEKTQKEYDDSPVDSSYQSQDTYGHHQSNSQVGYHQTDVEPERHGPPSPPGPPPSRYRSKYNRNNRPSKYSNEDYYESPASSRISKSQQVQEKSGSWSVHSAKNFARVAIPAIVLTGAALGICAVIFGWYISGDNREIAFFDPTTNQIPHGGHGHGHSRRKRSLSPATWSDGWLIRTLKAIHGNPYDNMPAPTAKSFVPYPYFLEKDSSKNSNMEFRVSNNGLAGVLAGGAVLAVVALGLINSFSEPSARNLKTARYNHLLTNSASSSASHTNSKTNPLTHLRAPRNMAHFDNDLEFQQVASSPSFFESIISSLEASGDTIMTKLNHLGGANWQQSSCTKRIVCQVIANQGDDTVKIMEKKMASVMKMLPESVSSSINESYNDLLSSIYKRDCSSFTCSHHKSLPVKSSSSSSQSSIDQSVTNNTR